MLGLGLKLSKVLAVMAKYNPLSIADETGELFFSDLGETFELFQE